MDYIKIPANKFIKTKIPLTKRCTKYDNNFISKIGEFILYQYENYMETQKLLTKKKAPLIIGVNGSVASGKSYIADKFAEKLTSCNMKCAILSTDNFIFSNKELEKRKIMHLKGFPDSYDWNKLIKVIRHLKKNETVYTPFYDQSISDISTKKHKIPKNMDIIIIEGINLLRPHLNLLENNKLHVKTNRNSVLLSDFLDISIFINAPETFLKRWFYKRLQKKKTNWKKIGIKKNLTRKTNKQFKNWAMNIWNKINSKNLNEFISPFKKRADIIISKDGNHHIKEVLFRL